MKCYFGALFLQTGQDLQALLGGADPAFLASLGDMEAGTVWNCRVLLIIGYVLFTPLRVGWPPTPQVFSRGAK